MPRPKAASTTSATEAPGDNVEEVIERSSEGVTVISDSQAHSVRALLHDHCGARF